MRVAPRSIQIDVAKMIDGSSTRIAWDCSPARVVELADTGGLNPPLLREVRVRSPPRALVPLGMVRRLTLRTTTARSVASFGEVQRAATE